MKHIAILAATAMISTSALAADYDNTAVKFTAQTEAYHLSVKAPETGATSFAIGSSTIAPLELEATWMRDGNIDNWSLNAGKSMDVPMMPVYAGADAKLTFGDSYTSDTRRLALTPHIGAKTNVMGVAPYAELGYTFLATADEWTDINRNSSYLEVGAIYGMTDTLDIKLSVTEARDVDFNNASDRQAEVGFTIKF